jgi:DNA-binding MarR family transcriptional regulator
MSQPLSQVVDEVRLLCNVMAQATEQLHKEEPVTVSMGAVLAFLARSGPATVPTVARDRGVTRQHVQALVNDLLELRLVSLDENPAHRRSVLVCLKPRGRRLLKRIEQRERKFFSRLDLKVGPDDLRRTGKTLRGIREAFERAL